MSDSATWLGGRYELLSVIGRGGMAEVWKARDHRLGRDVAVKRLRVDLASDDTFQARFQREAQSAAGLNHPNIVSVYDTGETTDPTTKLPVPYIVMELVEGHTLREVLHDGRKILPRRALEFTEGVLDALAYSHAAGIIHRDIKPANVMLTHDGTVKVMDFGIARAVADTSATMTQTAAVIGTAQYLSPEQARGETVDNRADIYATGCLLYELLCGRPPFIGDSPVSVAYQHVREIPAPPSSLDAEITPAMDAITLKALAKSPDDRYRTAKDMRDDISRVLSGQQPLALLERSEVGPDSDEESTRLIPATSAVAAASNPAQNTPTRTATTSDSPARTAPDEAGETEPERPRRRRFLVLWIVLALLVLSLLGYGVYRVVDANPSAPSSTVQMVKVPAVKGLSADGATSTLENYGLRTKVVHVRQAADTANQVVSQSPVAGSSVAKGSTVTITVNDGPKQLTIPSGIVGMTEAKAKEALKQAGFADSAITTKADDPKTESTTAKKGEVTAVSPDAGSTVDDGTTVTLTIATGTSIVPDLTGQTVKAAEQEAQAAGFKIDAAGANSDDLVTAQYPSASTTATRGTTISLTTRQTTTTTTTTTTIRETPSASASPSESSSAPALGPSNSASATPR